MHNKKSSSIRRTQFVEHYKIYYPRIGIPYYFYVVTEKNMIIKKQRTLDQRVRCFAVGEICKKGNKCILLVCVTKFQI
ncbi:hypothetical protein COD14_23845 [Bacillus cereus]|nr:hypothetical protein COD14_23845 [Bacillus cereus]